MSVESKITGPIEEQFYRNELSREAQQQRALGRLSELVQLQRGLQQIQSEDRTVQLPLVRRAVFSVYREARQLGVGEAAGALLGLPRINTEAPQRA